MCLHPGGRSAPCSTAAVSAPVMKMHQMVQQLAGCKGGHAESDHLKKELDKARCATTMHGQAKCAVAEHCSTWKRSQQFGHRNGWHEACTGSCLSLAACGHSSSQAQDVARAWGPMPHTLASLMNPQKLVLLHFDWPAGRSWGRWRPSTGGCCRTRALRPRRRPPWSASSSPCVPRLPSTSRCMSLMYLLVQPVSACMQL